MSSWKGGQAWPRPSLVLAVVVICREGRDRWCAGKTVLMVHTLTHFYDSALDASSRRAHNTFRFPGPQRCSHLHLGSAYAATRLSFWRFPCPSCLVVLASCHCLPVCPSVFSAGAGRAAFIACAETPAPPIPHQQQRPEHAAAAAPAATAAQAQPPDTARLPYLQPGAVAALCSLPVSYLHGCSRHVCDVLTALLVILHALTLSRIPWLLSSPSASL